MKIYLAGKIHKSCWRHEIVNDLRGALQEITCACREDSNAASTEKEMTENTVILVRSIFDKHDYVGPYFLSCDHGCWHGENDHGLGGLSRKIVKEMCLASIHRADLVFAWIDDPSCYGTIAEIGYAKSLGKRIWIVSPKIIEDLWFVYELANIVKINDSPLLALKSMLDEYS